MQVLLKAPLRDKSLATAYVQVNEDVEVAFHIIKGNKGVFLGPPSVKTADGDWTNLVTVSKKYYTDIMKEVNTALEAKGLV